MPHAQDNPYKAVWSNLGKPSLLDRIWRVVSGFLEGVARCFRFRECVFGLLVGDSDWADQCGFHGNFEAHLPYRWGYRPPTAWDRCSGFQSSDLLRLKRVKYASVSVL